MSLLSPWFLLGALAVGLPLWLHLLQRDNPVRLPFASLMFFEKRTESRFLERRLRYLLLLALRLALIALAVLAFAKPVWERPPAAALGDIPALHLIVLDTSASMGYAGRWDAALAEARAIINGLDGEDQAQIITTGPAVQVVTERVRDKPELLSSLAGLSPGVSRNSYGDVVEAVRSLAPEGDLPVETHLISDFQNSAMPGRFSDLVLPSFAALDIRNVGGDNDSNWAIESVRGDLRMFGADAPKLDVTVSGFSSEPARKTVTLEIDGKTVDSQSGEVPAMGRASFTFEGFEAPAGFSRAVVKLTPQDDLPADDLRYVALDNAEPQPILFVTNDRRRRDALYYSSALSSTAGAAFRLEISSPGEADRRDPNDYAFVVLSDISQLSTSYENRLREWVQQGGAVMIAAGQQIASRGAAPLSGQRLTASRLPERTDAQFQIAGRVDVTHPALREVERFQGVKFFRHVIAAPGEDDQTPLALADGAPLLVETQLGRGRVLLFASAFDNVWNDLPVHPVFVPFVVESARYLAGVNEESAQATVDSALELGRRREAAGAVQVFNPDGDRALSLSQSVSQSDIRLDQTGFYEIRSPRGVELVAVNPDARESNIRPMDADTLALWSNTGRAEGQQLTAEGGDSPVKPPPIRIWKLLLVLLAAIVLVESVVGNRYLNVQREV